LVAQGAAAVPALIDFMEERIESSSEAAYALGEIGQPAKPATPALVRCLQGPDAKLTDAAIWALDHIKPKLTKHLIPLFGALDKLAAQRPLPKSARTLIQLLGGARKSEHWTAHMRPELMITPALEGYLDDTMLGTDAAIALVRRTKHWHRRALELLVARVTQDEFASAEAIQALAHMRVRPPEVDQALKTASTQLKQAKLRHLARLALER
jgi:hypothetical protein